jgi:hypothetical protein
MRAASALMLFGVLNVGIGTTLTRRANATAMASLGGSIGFGGFVVRARTAKGGCSRDVRDGFIRSSGVFIA